MVVPIVKVVENPSKVRHGKGFTNHDARVYCGICYRMRGTSSSAFSQS